MWCRAYEDAINEPAENLTEIVEQRETSNDLVDLTQEMSSLGLS